MGILKFAVATLELDRPGALGIKLAHRHNFEYVPRKGFIYVRSRAISSRTNDNFDTFPAAELKKAYATFIGKPCFVNHHNDDHTRMRGVIIDAALHEDQAPDGTDDTWIEVLMEIDAHRFPRLAQAIIDGDIGRTSMGCDVLESKCSVCDNVARTPDDYCAHVKTGKGKRYRRRNPTTGKMEDVLAHEVCSGLSFFENSLLVEDPADPTAIMYGLDVRGIKEILAEGKLKMPRNAAKIDKTAVASFSQYCADGKWYDTESANTPAPALGAIELDHEPTGHVFCYLYDADGEIRDESFLDDVGEAKRWVERNARTASKIAVEDPTRVPTEVETLRTRECVVCGSEQPWNPDGRCPACGYLPPPKPFQAPDTDIAGRAGDTQGWFDPDLVSAPPFKVSKLASVPAFRLDPVNLAHPVVKGQRHPQGVTMAPNPAKQSVAAAARQRVAAQVNADLAAENARLREQIAANLRKKADPENPAQPVAEPAPADPGVMDTDQAINEPDKQNVDVKTPGGVLPDDGADTTTTPGSVGGDMADTGADDTLDVEAPVAGTDKVDPAAVNETQPNTKGETFGEPAYTGDWLNPGANTVPNIGGNAATGSRDHSRIARDAALVNRTRDRIWASLRLAKLNIDAGIAQGDLISVAQKIEGSKMSMEAIRAQASALHAVAQRQPQQVVNTPGRPARRAPSLASTSMPTLGALAAPTGNDEMLFEA